VGASRAAKAQSHERIVAAAAARMRQSGIDGVGVAELMKEAGLTQGGFYRHFASRDQLIAEAARHALAQGGMRIGKLVARARDNPLATLIDAYLSLEHRDDSANSCAVSSLANDIARDGVEARAAYTAQAQHYFKTLGNLLAGDAGTRRRRAITAFAAMAGAVAMARAVDDEALSREILDAVATELKETLEQIAT
jgi:TetR/AcrR family transcriptional repressor of nem operon